MMRFYQLPKEQWETFFDHLAASINGHRQVDIEVAGPTVGDQVVAHRVPLSGLTFDSKNDTFYVYSEATGAGEGLDHAIPHPLEIWVDFAGNGLSRIVVKEEGEQQQFVTLHDPIALPSSLEDELISFHA